MAGRHRARVRHQYAVDRGQIRSRKGCDQGPEPEPVNNLTNFRETQTSGKWDHIEPPDSRSSHTETDAAATIRRSRKRPGNVHSSVFARSTAPGRGWAVRSRYSRSFIDRRRLMAVAVDNRPTPHVTGSTTPKPPRPGRPRVGPERGLQCHQPMYGSALTCRDDDTVILWSARPRDGWVILPMCSHRDLESAGTIMNGSS